MRSSNKKNRKILLLEPNYKNKYPPIGLMKIATYHRRLGDKVTFYQGDLKKFIIDQICSECITKLENIENSILWKTLEEQLKLYITKKDKTLFEDERLLDSDNKPLIIDCLDYYRGYYLKRKYVQEPQWDRVCITTLFTFYWDITIKTIEFAKILVKNLKELKVGGVMASLIPGEIRKETGIRPIRGLLDRPFMLDSDIDLIIDELPLDYSILDEIDYQYSKESAYYGYMTKGCTNKCKFCAVPKIEPTFKAKIPFIRKINQIKRNYGDQQHLILMDNNVLASPKFREIIRDIKKIGFYKGAVYDEPNQLEISIRNLKKGLNDKAYIRRSYKLIHGLFRRLRGKIAQTYYNMLDEFNLLNLDTTTKENLLEAYPKLDPIYERFRPKTPKLRYVDFNQGTDCGYITEEKMRLISEIPIYPLRIAFDHIKLKEQYIHAIELAAKYGIKRLSNYLLYNYKDSPDELYERLQINMQLSEDLDLHLYSFPMKYIPIFGNDAKDRGYIGPKWNKKFIGAIQAILNVNRGIVTPPNNNNGKGRSFFEKAFGRNLTEFHELLYMPEPYIVYRKICEEELGYTKKWLDQFNNLTPTEFKKVKPIIENNEYRKSYAEIRSRKLREFLKHYSVRRQDVRNVIKEHRE